MVMQVFNLMPHPTVSSILQHSLSVLRCTVQDDSLLVSQRTLLQDDSLLVSQRTLLQDDSLLVSQRTLLQDASLLVSQKTLLQDDNLLVKVRFFFIGNHSDALILKYVTTCIN
jgi:hypothetical protein